MDRELALRLRRLGVLDEADAMGSCVREALELLIESEDHPYSRFRWSLTSDEDGLLTINAVPPEEETGWTPWERWRRGSDGPEREAWVADGISNEWTLLSAGDLAPRGILDGMDLPARLERARVPEALAASGIDVATDILEPLDAGAEARYRQYRWVVIPHHTVPGPVVYAIPAMHRSDVDPWESWYAGVAGGAPIHHVHFTAPRPECTGRWREGVDAPDRPPEVCGVDWYWYASDVRPALAPIEARS